MSADLDPAVEAAAQAYDVATTGVLAEGHEEGMAAAVAAAAPLIRAQERAAVAEEIAQRLEAEALLHRRTTWDSLPKAAEFAREHVTPKEKP